MVLVNNKLLFNIMKKLILLIPFLFACFESKKNQNKIEEYSSQSYKESISILDVADDSLFIWHGGGNFSMTFEDKSLYYNFLLSCGYKYPIEVNLNKKAIVAYWDLEPNCIYDIGLEKTFGLKQHPVNGKPFVSFYIKNDSTLSAVYEYPEWIEKFNTFNKEEYFSNQFTLQNLHKRRD